MVSADSAALPRSRTTAGPPVGPKDVGTGDVGEAEAG